MAITADLVQELSRTNSKDDSWAIVRDRSGNYTLKQLEGEAVHDLLNVSNGQEFRLASKMALRDYADADQYWVPWDGSTWGAPDGGLTDEGAQMVAEALNERADGDAEYVFGIWDRGEA